MKNLNKEKKWNQWLAGVVDGNGYLAIQKNVALCEMTIPYYDQKILAQIKQKLGGQIVLRSGAKSVRYRLSHHQGMKQLLYRTNGLIRNSQRIAQFQRLCDHFQIVFIPAIPIDLSNGYSAGFLIQMEQFR